MLRPLTLASYEKLYVPLSGIASAAVVGTLTAPEQKDSGIRFLTELLSLCCSVSFNHVQTVNNYFE